MKYFLVILVLLLAGCSQPYTQERVSNVQTEHMLASKTLYLLIQDLDNVVYERNYTELERDEYGLYYVKTFSSKVDSLASALRKRKIVSFSPLIDALEMKNSALKTIVNKYEIEKIRPALNETIAVCQSCHVKFRNP
jgi:hypothetical protein